MLKFIDIIVPISGRFGCNMWYDDGPLPAEQLQSSPPLSRKNDQTQTDNKRTGQAIIIIIFILVSH